MTCSCNDRYQWFDVVAGSLLTSYAVRVQLVEIIGTRWSSVAGNLTGDAPVSASRRIVINERWGVIIYGERRDEIDEALLRRTMAPGVIAPRGDRPQTSIEQGI